MVARFYIEKLVLGLTFQAFYTIAYQMFVAKERDEAE